MEILGVRSKERNSYSIVVCIDYHYGFYSLEKNQIIDTLQFVFFISVTVEQHFSRRQIKKNQ